MLGVVTGGCQGLGKSLTIELLNRGYEVVATYLTSEEEASEMENMYDKLTCVKCDVTKQEEVGKLFFNLDDVDLVINNAAIAKDNEYFDKSLDEFMEVVKVNLGGTFIVSRFAATRLKIGGTIINISSNNTLGNNSPLSMDYDASKAGVNLLTKDYAEALKSLNVKVIAVAPGWIGTNAVLEMNPEFLKKEMEKVKQKELIDPEKLASKIIDLVDEDIETGSIIEIKEVK